MVVRVLEYIIIKKLIIVILLKKLVLIATLFYVFPIFFIIIKIWALFNNKTNWNIFEGFQQIFIIAIFEQSMIALGCILTIRKAEFNADIVTSMMIRADASMSMVFGLAL